MTDDTKYVLLAPVSAESSKRRGPMGSALRWMLTLSAISFLGFSGLLTWQWAERNVLHWGTHDGKTIKVNQAELLQRLQVFQVVSVKDTYQANARIDVSKVLDLGPTRVNLPSWIAGRNMRA